MLYSSYKSVQLDNLTLHVQQLPIRMAEAMLSVQQASAMLAKAEPSDLVTNIPNVQAREFWMSNFGTEIVIPEKRLKVRDTCEGAERVVLRVSFRTGRILQRDQGQQSLRSIFAKSRV